MRRASLALAAAASFGVGLAGCMGAPPPPAPLNPVRFLLTANLHPPAAPDSIGKLARLATARQRIELTGPLLFVASGNIVRGASMAELNAAKLRYTALGPDELALSPDSLRRLIEASTFTWLAGNCEFPGLSPDADSARFQRWDTLRVSTHKVGIFGLSTPPAEASGVRCTQPATAARALVDTLVKEGADLIVALTYQDRVADRDLLLHESGLHLVLGGGENAPYTEVLAGRHLLVVGTDGRQAPFMTLWGGKDDWRQAARNIPIDDRLPPDSAVRAAARSVPR